MFSEVTKFSRLVSPYSKWLKTTVILNISFHLLPVLTVTLETVTMSWLLNYYCFPLKKNHKVFP